MDDVTSPCIDADDPNSHVAFEPFPNGGRINLGAYGGTPEASKSWFGRPERRIPVPVRKIDRVDSCLHYRRNDLTMMS